MAIANETIINKMLQELHQAKESKLSQGKLMEHIAHVRLLCDLFLEEDNSESVPEEAKFKSEFSQAEMKAMLGDQAGSKLIQQNQGRKSLDDDEANGDSIFDF